MYLLYLFLFLLGIVGYLYLTRKKSVKEALTEAFTVEDLPITISKDNTTLTVPSKINTTTGVLNAPTVTTTKATAENLTVTGTSTLGTVTANTLKVGNVNLGTANGLSVEANLQCKNMTVLGDMTLHGNLCIQSGNDRWYFVIRGGILHIVKNDINLANGYHSNNEPHVMISSDGNVWMSRQIAPGWIGESLQRIRSLSV